MGEHPYPTLLQQAAAYIVCIAAAHAFEGGNKRSAWLNGMTFLDMNGVEPVEIAQQQAEDFMVRVIDESLPIEAVAAWLNERI